MNEYKIIRRTKSTIILKFNDVNIIEKKIAILNLLLKTRLNNSIEIRKTSNCYESEDNNLHLSSLIYFKFQTNDKYDSWKKVIHIFKKKYRSVDRKSIYNFRIPLNIMKTSSLYISIYEFRYRNEGRRVKLKNFFYPINLLTISPVWHKI